MGALMSRFVFRLVVAVAAGVLLAGSSIAAAASVSHTVRVGSAPRRPAGSRVVGTLPTTTPVSVSVVLKPRDPAALQSYATAVSTPGSSVYHQYLSVAQFRQRFGPTASQIVAVSAALRAQGLKPGVVSANGLAIPVSSTAGTLSRAFSTSLQRVTGPGGQAGFANTAAPLVNSSVAGVVQGVVGLDNLAVRRPLALRAAHARARASGHVATGGPQPCSAASSSGSDTADQIASAYRFSSLYGAGDEGAGQTIALFELEPNLTSDISAYQSCYGTSATVNYVSVDGGAGSGEGQGEAALDIEQVIGLAPKATVDVYRAPNSDAGVYDEYSKIVTTDTAKAISTSWGLCETEASTAISGENTLFTEAATQGQSVFAAAGDSGSADCGNGALAVDDPGSQPFVTSVGGTSMPAIGPPPVETVWNNGYGAGGGGVSSVWGMPSYQSSAAPSLHVINSNSSGAPCGASPGSYCREVPDVSADADPNTGSAIRYDGSWGGFGGTSAAAPLWAALTALVNASSACAGSPIGFANPVLYGAADAAYSNYFNDITSGNNDSVGSNGGLYPAGAGYDMASGLGTPNGTSLPAELCATAVTVAGPSADRSVVGVPVSVSIRATNPSGKPLVYGASGLPAGLTINALTGVISGTPRAAGSRTVVVSAANSAGGFGTTSFTWIVDPVAVTVSNPGGQLDRIGTAARLQIQASDNDGRVIRYSAVRLPAGLEIGGSNGLVTGRTSNGGSYSVRVTARDGGASGSVGFAWTVKGPGTSGTSLSGVVAGKPKLVSTLSAWGGAPAIRAIVIQPPRGLSFSSDPSKGVNLVVSHGKRVKSARIRIVGGKLRITLSKGLGSVRLTIGPPAWRASSALVLGVKTRKVGTLGFVLVATDAHGHVTTLTPELKAA